MNDFLKEPIKRKIFILVFLFLSAFGMIFYFDQHIVEIDNAYKVKLTNSKSILLLNSLIILNISQIESRLTRFIYSKDLENKNKLISVIDKQIRSIEKIINVIKNGGTYKTRTGFNFVDNKGFTKSKNYDFELTYFPLKDLEISEDIVRSLSLLVKQLKSKLYAIITSSLNDNKTLHLDQANLQLQKVYNLVEDIYFHVHKKQELFKDQRIKSIRIYTNVYFNMIIIVVIVAIIIFIRIISQISSIIQSQKYAEKNIREAKEHADKLYKIVPSAVFTVDDKKNITSWNDRAAELTGYGADEVLGKKCYKYLEAACNSSCDLLKTDQTLSIISKESVIKTKNGDNRMVSKHTALLKDDTGEIIGSIESFEDITEQKTFQKELEQAKIQAESSVRAKSAFLANMSHELRTPMNSILGFADLLKKTQLNEKQNIFINTIAENGQILLHLINDVLDMSNIDFKKLKLEIGEFNLKELVQKIYARLKLKHSEKPITFQYYIEDDMPTVFVGDSVRVQQIITNLLDNAIKFTKKGKVVIKVTVDDFDPMQIKDSKIETFVNILVQDTGIGIPKEKQDIIFQPFVQVDSSITRGFGGSGLGLSIVKSLAEMMEGSISISSVEGKSSEFLVKIKLQAIV